MKKSLVLSVVVAVVWGCAGDGTGLDENGRPLTEGVSVTPEDAAIVVGGVVQLQGTHVDQAGNPTTNVVSWSVSDGTVATVDATGLVTGVSAGTTDVIAESGPARTAVSITVVASAAFGGDVQPIFNNNCALSGCHAGPTPQQGQDLTAGNAYSNIVGVASMELPSMLRVNPGDPLTSYLVHKIRGTQLEVNGQGVRMPFGGQLPQNQIDIIRAWVQNGAPNN